MFLVLLANAADEKRIRLRNELIVTRSTDRSALRLKQLEPAVSGLYLVQFEGALEPEWRTQLQAAGVELLRYIPDDAYVTRFSNARVACLRALPYVRWVGPYLARHKLDARLVDAGALPPLLPPAQPTIRVLLAPHPSVAEARRLTRLMPGFRLRSRSSIGTIFFGQASAAQALTIADSAAVLWVEPDSHPQLRDEVSSKIVGGDDGAAATPTVSQVLGFDGRGVTVAVADTGLDTGDAATMHPDLSGRVDAFLHYGRLDNASDGFGHGTHVTGIIAGNAALREADGDGYLYGLGVAPQARIVVQRIFDDAGNYESPSTNERLTRDAVRAGAVIGSNSWGEDTQGRYDLTAAEFDALVRDADAETPGDQPYILVFAAGNAGPGSQTVGSPAVAKNVIAVGASENRRMDLFGYSEGPDAVADFSSRGPCEDGRIKPDLVAPGTWIASQRSSAAPDKNGWLPLSASYQYEGGTSQAGSHVSGAVAAFVQFYRETQGGRTPSPALSKAALINAATDLDEQAGGTGPVPNRDEGWGRVALTNLVSPGRSHRFWEQDTSLHTGQSEERLILVGDRSLPLRITLAYTDTPGFPAAVPALVNDLDLEVVAPDGTLYAGNQFDQGDSVANPEPRDSLNNVESVYLRNPLAGEYRVRVLGRKVTEGPRRGEDSVPRQDYALVASGDLPAPGEGALLFDRGAYRTTDEVKVRLIDFDLAERDAVEVTVRSSTEPEGERLRLVAAASRGVFTNTLSIRPGSPTTDGLLQVGASDTLTSAYADERPAGERSARARIDVQPPVLSAVSVTNRFGQATIRWQTDEPATATVYFSTNGAPPRAASVQRLRTDHEITLDYLPSDLVTRFYVVSVDEAGNSAQDDQQGRWFEIKPESAPTVLIVDAFNDAILDIPVETYTEALARAEISHQVWNLAAEGRAPTQAELRPYQVVMWRVPEFFGNLSASEVKVLRDFVEGGGSLFLASMELLSRLDDAGFSSFRRNVLHVESYEMDTGVRAIDGAANLSMTSGLRLDLDFSGYPDLIVLPPDISDTFTTTTNGVSILTSTVNGRSAGVRYPRTGEEGRGRVVFLSFPIDTVPMEGEGANSRVALMRSIVDFLAPGRQGQATIELGRARYSIPSQVMIELADSDLSGNGLVSVELTTDRQSQPRPIVLHESRSPGLFRGSVTLVGPEIEPTEGQVKVKDGEKVRLAFRDESNHRVVQAVAVVDTDRPHLTQVVVTPDYAEATVAWETSEAADATVQFGETRFLGRTAYSAVLAQQHSLKLTGLLPDREYFFQVVSRDDAGNASVDDRGGALYSFRTLKPWAPPFTDDLENGGAHWIVLEDAKDSRPSVVLAPTSWQLGPPDNELATKGHSGTNAWGTNLRGVPNDYANTSLVTPSFDLSAGNQATLRFWHNYDFLPRSPAGDNLQTGGLYISTNNAPAWLPLTDFHGTSQGWKAEEVDLTPYVGNVVRLGWSYALFSLDAVVHPGWLVDDIQVVVTNVIRGTLTVSNNLSQAGFTVSGPVSYHGTGWRWVLTNAPLGEYLVKFDPVPYYETPAPITHFLQAATNVTLSGVYRFADLNQNQIPDTWEEEKLGAVLTNSASVTDHDLDGLSDADEFTAGTDPTQGTSGLWLSPPSLLPNQVIRFDFASTPGRAYRIQGTTNLVDWSGYSGWVRAANDTTTIILPAVNAALPHLFRLEVRP